MYHERRRKRSSYVALSLQYWLRAIAKREQLFALVLADSAGLLVAGSLPGPEAEELAAVAPLLARPKEGYTPAPREKIPVTIKQMQLDKSSLYLCAVGNEHRSKTGLRLAAGGVRRILAPQ